MGRNKAQSDLVMLRREFVARLRVQGMTQRAIAQQLAKLVDPATKQPVFNDGTPYDIATISRDVKALEVDWLHESRVATEFYKARELAQVQEVIRLAFAKGDLSSVLRGIELEAKLTGSLVDAGTAGQSASLDDQIRAAGIDPVWLREMLLQRRLAQGRLVEGVKRDASSGQ
jgi:hypothetical protein